MQAQAAPQVSGTLWLHVLIGTAFFAEDYYQLRINLTKKEVTDEDIAGECEYMDSTLQNSQQPPFHRLRIFYISASYNDNGLPANDKKYPPSDNSLALTGNECGSDDN